MKKGLRNTIASLALSGMSLFGGIKQANAAGWIDSEKKAQEAAEQVFKDAKFESTWTEEDIEGMRAEVAAEAVKAKEMLPTLLKLVSQKNGIDFSKMKEVTLVNGRDGEWGISYPGGYGILGGDGSILRGAEFNCEGIQYDVNPQKGTFRWSKSSFGEKYVISSPKEIEMGKGKDLKALSQERALELLNYSRIGLERGTNVLDNVRDNVLQFYQKNGLTEADDLKGGITFLLDGGRHGYKPNVEGVFIRRPSGKIEGYRVFIGKLSNVRLEEKDSHIFQRGEDGKLHSMDDFFEGAIMFDFDEGTYRLTGSAAVPFGNGHFNSPEMSITPAKEKTKAKTVSPVARKAISERLQKN